MEKNCHACGKPMNKDNGSTKLENGTEVPIHFECYCLKDEKVGPEIIKEEKPVMNKLTAICPVCNQPGPPIQGYHAKLIPCEMMSPSNRPECDVKNCKNTAWWNINNGGQILCEKHFKGLVRLGFPVIILSKSLIKDPIKAITDAQNKK